ncbi:unnamed protein product [Protopolystoma xenopodis]|uniref:Uncharacterized protein n=1 Tax=Protopolystoma xenopodis TaxID=117903 RepID=A0A3S5BPM2_9PLAT|nr:unnamed protein product [Protopolystoma xenopodis]
MVEAPSAPCNSNAGGIHTYEGLRVISPTEFEVQLYLNQMGVFNFVDDGSVPGGAVLKLSDGRKRSMSLWVEFITASGYLSARKIRARFHGLVGQAVEKCTYRDILRLMPSTSEVKIRIRDRASLQITPAFRCPGLWPRSASHWSCLPTSTFQSAANLSLVPVSGSSASSSASFSTLSGLANTSAASPVCLSSASPASASVTQSTPIFMSTCSGSVFPVSPLESVYPSANGTAELTASAWPSPALAAEVKREGFSLLSQESLYTRDRQASAEGDAWLLDFHDAEERLLAGSARRRCLDILETLSERHLNLGLPGQEESGWPEVAAVRGGGEEGQQCLVKAYHLKSLVLHECEKHPREEEWHEAALPDRVNGVLLQLISCLQHRRCPHYFLPQLDLFRGKSPVAMDLAAKQAWNLLRALITSPRALERL